VASGGPDAIAHARRQLARIDQISVDRPLLDAAASLSSDTVLRSLDAIHLGSARMIGAELGSVVTYDRRMAAAAVALGLGTEAPS